MTLMWPWKSLHFNNIITKLPVWMWWSTPYFAIICWSKRGHVKPRQRLASSDFSGRNTREFFFFRSYGGQEAVRDGKNIRVSKRTLRYEKRKTDRSDRKQRTDQRTIRENRKGKKTGVMEHLLSSSLRRAISVSRSLSLCLCVLFHSDRLFLCFRCVLWCGIFWNIFTKVAPVWALHTTSWHILLLHHDDDSLLHE